MDFDDLVKKKKIALVKEDLCDGNLDVLVEVLRTSNVLEGLWLNGNRLTLADWKMAEAIARSPTLRVLYLENNQIGGEGAKRLAGAIKVSETLQEICLWGNRIGDEGAESFADALAVNKSLEVLILAENAIGDEGAQSLAASFETNRTLQRVFLEGNNITDQGALRLAESLTKNCTIDKLDLGGFISSQAWKKIKAIIKDESRMHFWKIITSKDEEIAALKETLAALKETLATKNRAIDLLKKKPSRPPWSS